MQEVSSEKSKSPVPTKAVSSGGSGFFRQLKRFGNQYMQIQPASNLLMHAQFNETKFPPFDCITDIYPKLDENYRVRTWGGAVCKLHKSYVLLFE